MGDGDLWVDFRRMLDDGRVRTYLRHPLPGFLPVPGRHAIVGCEHARPAVAMILSLGEEASIEVQVLPGTVDDNRSPGPGPVTFDTVGGGER